MKSKSGLPSLPVMPGRTGEPAFSEPWEASVFAIAVSLNQAGLFEWTEWVECFSKEIKQAEAAHGPNDHGGDHYYRTWFAALEKLVVTKKIFDSTAIDLKQKYFHDNPVPHDHNPRREPIAVA